ncbi:hypothetical protein HJC10_11225 [Corallococcus exiguus]|uniref:hypothetical protein n=1 Tax=Corallococcus exiguus TaxID=83462 RepID=UPI00147156B1|nr:hypothetical protein [Corallococcus exiguus]NNB91310.1 hypothetical protein [Corallococcus exiguus]NNC03413.1 hypothetical protein [Corallococcus exiguus]
MLLGLERALAASGLDAADRWTLVVLLLLPCLELLQGGVDAVFTRCFKEPPPMPRMDPERVLSKETRTLVVTPLLVASLDDIETQLRRLERNFQGNVSPELFFALLTDFPDASQKEIPEEAAMLLRLEDGIRLLNARHCPRKRRASSCCIANGGGIPWRAVGWGGSASGASWRSSTGWCSGRTTRATWGPYRASFGPSGMSLPWMPTRTCSQAPRRDWSPSSTIP